MKTARKSWGDLPHPQPCDLCLEEIAGPIGVVLLSTSCNWIGSTAVLAKEMLALREAIRSGDLDAMRRLLPENREDDPEPS